MSYFFLSESERERKSNIDEYNQLISQHVKIGNLNLLEYSYLLTYLQSSTLVNSNWYLNLINRLKDENLVGLIPKVFQMFKSDFNEIKHQHENLTEEIVKYKNGEIEFTQDQLNALNEIFSFLRDFSQKTYGLYGFAGTGKTTVLVEIVVFLIKHGLIKSVAFTAPTNKAVNVIKFKFATYLKELIPSSSFSSSDTFEDVIMKLDKNGITVDFMTIHKLLKFEMDYDFDGGIYFNKSADDSLIDKYELVIIDECSMIPVQLVNQIFTDLNKKVQKLCDNYKRSPKIIFSGDPAQLPPVNENFSVLFLKGETTGIHPDLVKTIENMPTYTLKKVMRSKLQAVTNVCLQIRLWTMGELKIPNVKKHIGKGTVVYEYKKEQKINTHWFKKSLEYFEKGKSCSIILTWTNKQADEYNYTIRKTLFHGKSLKKYEVGDILVLNDFYNFSEDKEQKHDIYNDSSKGKFHTSEQIKVVGIEMVTKKIQDFAEHNRDLLKLENGKYYDTKYRETVQNINKYTTRQYLCWALNVKRLEDTLGKHDNTISTIYVLHDDAIAKYEEDKIYISESIKRLRKLLVQKFRTKATTIDNNITKKMWKDYHKNLIAPFANVNYGYAITCHKGQGSNFFNVFVDADDIVKNGRENETKKCLYTALTRASNELHMLF